MREAYKGFYLNPGANELQHDLGFSPTLTVEQHTVGGLTAAEVAWAHGVYETREAAISAALIHGRHSIDQGFQLDCWSHAQPR